MVKVKEYRIPNQPISNDDVRLSILRIAQKNGGLKSLAHKSGMTYHALWGQLNRNAGVLAYAIPRIVNGSGSLKLLQKLGDGCGAIVRWAEKPGPIKTDLLDLPIKASDALKIIRDALADGRITRNEYREIHTALVEVRRVGLGLDFKLRVISK